MKRLFLLLVLLIALASTHAEVIPLGYYKNAAHITDLAINAIIDDEGSVEYIKLECQTSELTPGEILIKASDVPKFVNTFNRMDVVVKQYSDFIKTGGDNDGRCLIDGFPKVTYQWGYQNKHKDNEADFELSIVANDNGSFWIILAHEATDDVAHQIKNNFVLRFNSPDELKYIALLMSDENVSLCIKKKELLSKIHVR